jgi:outer membrane lipoprotein SlyB
MKAVAALALAGLVAGCAYPQRSGNVYQNYQAQTEQIVRTGTVESVRNVTIANPNSGVGAASGAALGGLAGSAGGEGAGQAALVIAGALVGGLLGQHIESNVNNQPGLEITVRLDTGDVRAITQTADEMFLPGERVRLLSDAYGTRVTH